MRFYAWLLLLNAVGGSSPIGPWRTEEVSPSSALVRRETQGIQTMTDAKKMALEGLEMGYRVLGTRLNAVMAECHIDDRISFGELQPDDSMTTARNLVISALPAIDKTRYAQGRIYAEWPWTLGFLSGFHIHGYPDKKLEPYKVRLGDDHDCELAEIENLRSRKAWSPEDWRRWVIEPITAHHDAWVNFISQQSVEPDGFFTGRKQDIAKALSTTVRTLMKHIEEGKYEGSDLGGQTVRIHKRHLPPNFS